MEFDFVPVFEFITIHFDFQFLFRWPDTLRIDFQIVLFFSISLILFERAVAILVAMDEYMQKFKVEQKHFRAPMWMVRVPYWLGETYFKLFEMGWELLVMVYALVAQMLYYLPYRGLYRCFNRKGRKAVYPFRKEDRKAIEKGFMYGLYDAVGKSGWYAFYKMKFGDEYDEKIGNGRIIEATIYQFHIKKFHREKQICLSIT